MLRVEQGDIMNTRSKEYIPVHFLVDMPNNKRTANFIKEMKKFLNTKRYGIRLRGRGPRKKYGAGPESISLKLAERVSVYVYQKTQDINNPDFAIRKFWKIRNLADDLVKEATPL